jgi:hypothetical protein
MKIADSLELCPSTATHAAVGHRPPLSAKESRMKLANATNLDRKSGGSAVDLPFFSVHPI